MDTATILALLAIIVLLLLSALFSGSETALTAASRARVRRMAQDGSKRAMTVRRLLENKEDLLGALLLGNNLANITASALATSLFLQFFGEAGVAYATIAMTTIVLIFAEVLPKTYAISNPDRMALGVGPIVSLLTRLFGPVVMLVQHLVRMTLRILGIDIAAQQNVLSASDEIRGVVDLHASEGTLVKAHRDMVGSVLDLDEVHLEDVMVHRRNMVSIDLDQPVSEIVRQVAASRYTRLPVWQGDPENIIGVINAKDILRAVHKAGGDVAAIDIASLMSQPWFVPETTTLREQLNAFRARRSHLALVVDEYGAIMGVITLEDILEEIVGEIADEHDAALPTGLRARADGSVVVEGSMPIRDLNREADWDLPDHEATTVAGLVLHVAEHIPNPGEKFTVNGFDIEVLRRLRNQITAVRITPPMVDENVE